MAIDTFKVITAYQLIAHEARYIVTKVTSVLSPLSSPHFQGNDRLQVRITCPKKKSA